MIKYFCEMRHKVKQAKHVAIFFACFWEGDKFSSLYVCHLEADTQANGKRS